MDGILGEDGNGKQAGFQFLLRPIMAIKKEKCFGSWIFPFGDQWFLNEMGPHSLTEGKWADIPLSEWRPIDLEVFRSFLEII